MALVKKTTKLNHSSFGIIEKNNDMPKEIIIYFLGIPIYKEIIEQAKSNS